MNSLPFALLIYTGYCTPEEADQMWENLRDQIPPDRPSLVLQQLDRELAHIRGNP